MEHKNILPFLGLVDLSVENIAETGLVSPWEQNGNVNDYYQKYPDVNRTPMVRPIHRDMKEFSDTWLSDPRHSLRTIISALTGHRAWRSTRSKSTRIDEI